MGGEFGLAGPVGARRSEFAVYFDDGLDKTILFFEEAPKDRNNLLMFLSDGIPNVVGDGDNEEEDPTTAKATLPSKSSSAQF